MNRFRTFVLAVAIAAIALPACGGDDGVTAPDATGNYAVNYTVIIGDFTFLCPGTFNITDQSDGSFSGNYNSPATQDCPPASGTFSGTVQENGAITIPGFFEDFLELDEDPSCGVTGGNSTMQGTLSGDAISAAATAEVTCTINGTGVLDVTLSMVGTRS
jgi:hypothetical protein